MDDLEKELKNTIEGQGLIYSNSMMDKTSIAKIHSLWVNDKFVEPVGGTEFGFYGAYYTYVKNDMTLAKKYYLMAIDAKNSGAMYNLALIYQKEKDYESAKKYYLMAVDKDLVRAMYELGNLYNNVDKDKKLAKKYLSMAARNGDYRSIPQLVSIYTKEGKLSKVLYYYLLTGQHDEEAKYTLADILRSNTVTFDKYFFDSLPYLQKIKDPLPASIKLIIKLYSKEVDVLENAFKYAPGQDGYQEALKDYQQRLSS